MTKGAADCKYVVKLKFTFGGHVPPAALKEAIGRALNTKQFRLAGQYTILEMYEEKMEEVSREEPKFKDPLARQAEKNMRSRVKPVTRAPMGPTTNWPAVAAGDFPLGPTSGGPTGERT